MQHTCTFRPLAWAVLKLQLLPESHIHLSFSTKARSLLKRTLMLLDLPKKHTDLPLSPSLMTSVVLTSHHFWPLYSAKHVARQHSPHKRYSLHVHESSHGWYYRIPYQHVGQTLSAGEHIAYTQVYLTTWHLACYKTRLESVKAIIMLTSLYTG